MFVDYAHFASRAFHELHTDLDRVAKRLHDLDEAFQLDHDTVTDIFFCWTIKND
jgi:hypothetical protein